MRLSVNCGDDGHSQWISLKSLGRTADIFLDGVWQANVVTVDDEAGTVLRYKTGDDGRLIVDGDEFICELVKGEVEIRLRDAS
ncbi:hypothetical protein [Shinella sp.]|uniref:hypothetical protein n=1 Tax=Shinella sp. TaxID=1870904 RepID=UPI0028AFFD90|nr:hypothetical protein [Shinella sp.]